MELRTCERCNKAFIRTAPLQILCQSCIELEEKEFLLVKEFLVKHPGANAETIAEALEIPQKTILRFIQGGRLETTVRSNVLVCSNCGKKIDKGTLCPECQALLRKELQSVARPVKKIEPDADSVKTASKSTGFHIRRTK